MIIYYIYTSQTTHIHCRVKLDYTCTRIVFFNKKPDYKKPGAGASKKLRNFQY